MIRSRFYVLAIAVVVIGLTSGCKVEYTSSLCNESNYIEDLDFRGSFFAENLSEGKFPLFIKKGMTGTFVYETENMTGTFRLCRIGNLDILEEMIDRTKDKSLGANAATYQPYLFERLDRESIKITALNVKRRQLEERGYPFDVLETLPISGEMMLVKNEQIQSEKLLGAFFRTYEVLITRK